MYAKKEIVGLILKQLATAGKTEIKKEEVESMLEVPPSIDMGDFSLPCFKLAGKLKENPVQIAENLSKGLKIKAPLSRIEAKNGYLNFFVDKNMSVKDILDNVKEDYGKEKQNEKILLEHTSINPNASPHVGRTRNSIIGDSVYRILSFLGNKVERHYYVNDVSKQVAILSLNFKQNDKFKDLLNKYVKSSKDIEEKPELEKKVFELLHKFEHKDKKTTELFNKIVKIAIDGQKAVLSNIGIEFDYFDYESRYMDSGKEIIKELEKTGKVKEDEEKRLILDQKGTGLEWKMKSPVLVLTRSDKTGLYVLRDLAYTIDKCKKGRNIIILGEDQKLYFEQLKQALILLRKPYPEVMHYSFVLLKDIGKMSTRRGEVVLLEDFFEEAKKKAIEEIKQRKTKGDPDKIAIAAIKYSMLKNDNDKNITFDLEQSLNFEGETGPYLQYSYARASSIMRKAKKNDKSKLNKKANKLDMPEKLSKEEIELAKKIEDFPEIVKNAAKNLNPSIIAHYSFQLCQIFNEFYHNNQVVGSKEEAFRLKLVEAFKITIKNALYILGIEVMEEM